MDRLRKLLAVVFERQDRSREVREGIFARARIGAVAGAAVSLQRDECDPLVLVDDA